MNDKLMMYTSLFSKIFIYNYTPPQEGGLWEIPLSIHAFGGKYTLVILREISVLSRC
jgi:hypothetical protein